MVVEHYARWKQYCIVVLGPGEKRSTKSVECVFNYQPKGDGVYSRRVVLLRDEGGKFLCYGAEASQLKLIDAAVNKIIAGLSNEVYVRSSCDVGARSEVDMRDVELVRSPSPVRAKSKNRSASPVRAKSKKDFNLKYEREHVDGFEDPLQISRLKDALMPKVGRIFSTTDSLAGCVDDRFKRILSTICSWNAEFNALRPLKLAEPNHPSNQAAQNTFIRPDLSSYPSEEKFQGIADSIIRAIKEKIGDKTLQVVVSLFNGACEAIPNGYYSNLGARVDFIFALDDFCDVTFIREDECGAVNKNIVCLKKFEVVEFSGQAMHRVHYHNTVWGERSYLLVSVYDAEHSGGFHYKYCVPHELYKNVV